MKTYTYNITAFLLLFSVALNAQTFDKKIKENFKVNSDVEIVINAAFMDVDIETWNRNEVSVEAVMEVEGVEENEAKKILKQWKFEALGNKSKVKISSLSDNMHFEFDSDFDFPGMDFEIPHFEIPDMDFDFPEIPFPEMPEMPEMPEFEFDYQLYKSDSTYLKNYKMRVSEGVEKFKNSNWKKQLDSVRNSHEFKKQVEEYKKAAKEIAKEMKELQNSEAFKHSLEEAKRVAEEAKIHVLENRDEILEQVKMAKEANKAAMAELKRLKKNGKFDSLHNYRENILDSLHNYTENVYFLNSTNKNSKVKIKKYLKIKVPKKATFDLNVRHGKVNIPESNKKMSANMSYSNFVGGLITGSKNELSFSNSPVEIETLNASNITLKNVPNAKFGTFENSNLFSNSSDVSIEKIGSNVALSQKFGNLEISNIVTDFEVFNLILDYSKANINLSNAKYAFQINGKKSTISLNKKLTTNKTTNRNDGVQIMEGYYLDKSTLNKLFLTGVYSTIILD
ncbi:hypothetical protein BX611_2826 [Lutibacter oceani]|uniref:Uncharacterized protein n=1 Tax=Lutibacter oceani TaxID=1853311 RepID=A0A3D9RRZ3_9FLAO|nr:hypothetical protein [Lutibacter oceani]REE79926.1 hypothetical protein BX611_2826 [Lutibacter oceani]